MAISVILLSLLIILSCTYFHTNFVVGENHHSYVYGVYAEKTKGTLITIKRQDGDVVDCVDIYKQPSTNHPLLKNHTLQFKPPFPSSSLIDQEALHSNHINVYENKRCPNGSVPIRRHFKEEFTKASLQPSRHAYLNYTNANKLPNVVNKYAVFDRVSNDSDLTAISSLINVWRPNTDDASLSLAQLWVAYTSGYALLESITAGWMVYPNKYNDREPRFFIFYTNDGYNTGCYNNDCPGFIQVDPTFCLGCKISPYSIYNGEQFGIDLAIRQNKVTKDWWIRYQNVMVGYYPHTLFPRLSESGATHAEWGGEVSELSEATRPGPKRTQMGSGHFPEEGFKKAACFQGMLYEVGYSNIHKPRDGELKKLVSHPKCYRLSPVFGNGEGGEISSSHFYFGGEGGGDPSCDVSC